MAHDAAEADELGLHLLVLGCQAGSDDAFAKLFGRFSGRTLAYLRGLLDDEAEDVQQEVWLTVYRRIRDVANPRAFRTWLYQTTRHRAIDQLRRRRREQALLADVASETEEVSVDESGPANLAGLADLMAELTPAHREVLLLRYEEDLSYADIALVTGCSVGTVRSRLHHAKRRLADLTGRNP